MQSKVMVLSPSTPAVLKRTERYNAIAQDLGENLVFVHVDSNLHIDQIASASAGAIAVTTPAYRAIPRGIVTELAQRVPSLKLLQTSTAGTDTYDKVALAKLGVVVANHGGANAVAVAEHTIALMFSVYRKLDQQIDAVRRGEWNAPIKAQPIAEFRTLVGKKIGIIGLGNIGSRVAKRLKGWECEVSYTDVRQFDAAYQQECGAQYLEFDVLLQNCDIIALCVPLEVATRHLISVRELALMKPGAIVINTARGPVLDQAALVAALKSGQVFGAGLDVTEVEPLPADHELLTLPNVIVTPHLATRSLESEHNTYRFVVQNIGRLVRAEPLQSLVVPQ